MRGRTDLIVQLEEAKYKLLELSDAVKELASAIKIDKLTAKIEELEEQTAAPGFWEMEGTGKILQDLKRAKDKIEEYNSLKAQTEDALTLAEMGIEENDESVVDEVLAEVAEIEKGEEKTKNGVVWTTKSSNDEEIAEGTICKIVEVQGNTIIVEPQN